MKTKIFLTVIILIGLVTSTFPQIKFRSAVLLTHSSGGRLYDYDAYLRTDSTDISVPLELDDYNTTNGYVGDDEVQMDMRWFPDPLGTDWINWLGTIRGEISGNGNNFWAKLDTFNVIIINGGIQTTQMTGYGSPSDTSGSHITDKTVETYKWILRELVEAFEDHPETFFSILTGAACPERFQTINGARLSQEFSGWMKDTLALGLDPVYGTFPDNIYIFDYFTFLADVDGNLKAEYEIPAPIQDYHQNATACDVIVPLFVEQIFNAALAYEESLLPVELSSLSAMIIGSSVKLNWRTQTEVNNFGIEVERCALSAEHQTWEKIGFVNGNGNSNSPKNYTFEDNGLLPGKYSYRLKQIDNDGPFEYSKTIQIDFNSPKKFELNQNYPNPFNPITTVQFSLPESGNARLTLFNSIGQEVKTLLSEYKESGTHLLNFDGSELSSGLYFYKLESGSFAQTMKMILLK